MLALSLSSPINRDKPKKQDTLVWEQGRLLTWKDFKGKPIRESSNAALSSISIEYRWRTQPDGRFLVDIYSLFYRRESWVNPLLESDRLLAHEQYHFHIAEIFARRLRKEASSLLCTKLTCREEFDSVFSKTIDKHDAFQHQYDLETDYSRNPFTQIEVQQRIDSLLHINKDFTDQTIEIMFK